MSDTIGSGDEEFHNGPFMAMTKKGWTTQKGHDPKCEIFRCACGRMFQGPSLWSRTWQQRSRQVLRAGDIKLQNQSIVPDSAQ